MTPTEQDNEQPMTNQSELRRQILAKLREFGVSGGRFEERTDHIMGLLTAFITANYTPNTKVELLKSRIAWLEGKLEGMGEMIELTKDKEEP